MKVKIDYVEIQNFRQYRKAKFIFPDISKNKNLIIIKGGNGEGKTNFLNAITWCLYGEEYNIRDKRNALPKLNLVSFDEAAEGEILEMYVEIKFSGEHIGHMIVRRYLNYMKRDNFMSPIISAKSKEEGSFTLLQKQGNNMVSAKDPNFVINKLMPKSIEEYFFFDGEKLDVYFKHQKREDIKKAVYKISQITLLENFIDRLIKRKRELLKQSKTLNPKVEEIKKDILNLESALNIVSTRLDFIKKEEITARDQIKTYSDKLVKYSNIDVQELEGERIQLEKKIESLNENVLNNEYEKLKFLVNSTPNLFLYQTLDKTKEMIQEAGEAGKIPSEFQIGFLERLIRELKCICGNDLEKDTKAKNTLAHLMNKMDTVSKLEELLIRMDASIRSRMLMSMKFDEKRIGMSQTIKNLNDSLHEKNKRVQEIAEQFQSFDKDEVLNLETKKQEYKQLLEDCIGKKGIKEVEFKETESKLESQNTQLRKELEKDKSLEKLRKRISFCDESEQIANQIKDEIMVEIRSEIQSKTQDQFFKLIWKADEFDEITISDEYQVSLKHKTGREAIGSLSAGEGIILSMAFMAALNIVSGFNTPIIIDTPLGRISSENRRNIAKNLPNFLPEKQVLMLVTDTEFTDDIYQILKKNLSKMYNLKFSETGLGGFTEVTEIG